MSDDPATPSNPPTSFGPRYIVSEILPANQVHILAGASGAGKTTLLYQFVDALRLGQSWFGHPVLSGLKVAYVCCDRSTEDYEQKFRATGIQPFPVHSLLSTTGPGGAEFDPEDIGYSSGDRKARAGAKKLRVEWLERIWGASGQSDVLILDPLSPFLPSDLRNYHAVASALTTLNRFCGRRSVTILGVHHAAKLHVKDGFARPQDRILGSAALQGYSGTHLFLTDAAEIEGRPGYHTFDINPHNSPPEHYQLQRDSRGLFEPWVDRNVATLHDQLLLLIPTEPGRVKRIDLVEKAVNELDRCASTIDKLIKEMLKDGRLIQPEYGCYARPAVTLAR